VTVHDGERQRSTRLSALKFRMSITPFFLGLFAFLLLARVKQYSRELLIGRHAHTAADPHGPVGHAKLHHVRGHANQRPDELVPSQLANARRLGKRIVRRAKLGTTLKNLIRGESSKPCDYTPLLCVFMALRGVHYSFVASTNIFCPGEASRSEPEHRTPNSSSTGANSAAPDTYVFKDNAITAGR
jgi:hypothetical protein